MNIKLISALASICIVCALLIMGEWFYALWAEKSTLSSLVATDTKTSHDDMPDINLNEKTEQSFADLVTRPLFIKGRKPVDEPTPEETQNAAAAAPVVFDWELNGVYTTSKGLSALFSRSKSKVAKDNYRKISLGADLDGWKLSEIFQDKVVLKQGAQQKDLPLRKIKAKDSSKKPIDPNIPVQPQPEENPVPAEGEIETTNE
jgi:hypothetical protein